MPAPDSPSAQAGRLVERALADGRVALLEPEGYTLLTALGIGVPPWRFLPRDGTVGARDLDHLGARVVVKVVSRTLVHKTERGGVRVVDATLDGVRAVTTAMRAAFAGEHVEGFLIAGFVPHPEQFGGELLVSLRRTADFGPVVSVGLGGVAAEEIARGFLPEHRMAVFDGGADRSDIERRLTALPVARAAAGLTRGGECHVTPDALAGLVRTLLDFGATEAGGHVAELEVNPLALAASGPVALDALVRLVPGRILGTVPRPTDKLSYLLEPASVAVVGVSDGMNVGRRILRNLLQGGYPADRVTVIKPGTDRIDGVRCRATFADLAEPVDLCVLAVGAGQIPGLVGQIVDGQAAESVIVIPGGLGERAGTASLAAETRAHLDRARATAWRGPVLNGGNCLGLRSAPGRLDTTFIPPYKVGRTGTGEAPVALVSQSGAFAVARWSKLGGADPRYLLSVGNQLDLTIGDYLEYLQDDADVRVFACYIEGFQPGDGARWLAAARAIVASGRTVLLYRAGRTPAGRAAGVSHTAAIAGDYAVTAQLARAAGVIVADTLDEFDDVLRLATLLADRPPPGGRVGAVTNAGFECVAFGDGTGALALADLAPSTLEAVGAVLDRAGLGGVVEARHPVDLTPIMTDEDLVEVVRLVMRDPGVDVTVAGVVPHTAALRTLPAGEGHDERLDDPAGLVAGMAGLRRDEGKPLVAVVDAGAAYDPLAAALDAARVPTFRTMDRALRALALVTARGTRAQRPAPAPALAGAAH